MGRSVKQIVEAIRSKVDTLNSQQNEYDRYKYNTTISQYGSMNRLSRLINKTKSDILFYVKELKSKGKGNIVSFTLKVDERIIKGVLVNITISEVEQLVAFQSEFYRREIEILEIQNTPTSFIEVGL